MAGPRDYTAGTERALFHVAKGTCYHPDCGVPLFTWIAGEPVISVDIAHIYGAYPNSARYDPDMTDDDRRAFSNLIFLCVAHHKLVDRLHPADYPPELLQEWKVDSEGEGANILAQAAGLSEHTVERIITEVVRNLGPTREVVAELRAGVMLSEMETVASPFTAHAALLAANAHMREMRDVVVVDVRNTGTLAVEVTSVEIHWDVRLPDADGPVSLTLMGRNDFPRQNPALPRRLLDGARMTWLTSGNTIRDQQRQAAAVELVSLHAEIQLATGETVSTPEIPWGHVQAAGFADQAG